MQITLVTVYDLGAPGGTPTVRSYSHLWFISDMPRFIGTHTATTEGGCKQEHNHCPKKMYRGFTKSFKKKRH